MGDFHKYFDFQGKSRQEPLDNPDCPEMPLLSVGSHILGRMTEGILGFTKILLHWGTIPLPICFPSLERSFTISHPKPSSASLGRAAVHEDPLFGLVDGYGKGTWILKPLPRLCRGLKVPFP